MVRDKMLRGNGAAPLRSASAENSAMPISPISAKTSPSGISLAASFKKLSSKAKPSMARTIIRLPRRLSVILGGAFWLWCYRPEIRAIG